MSDIIEQPARQSSKSWFADESAAQQAVQMVLPMVVRAMGNTAVGESGFLYIVVMDPATDGAVDDFASSILYEYAVGDRNAWDADYAAFARDKARVCWRTRRSGHAVHSVSPHLLRAGDSAVWGGAWTDGIAVGVSGANPWYDEAFAGCIAHCLKAIAKGRALQQAAPARLGEP